jgi:hypothetical protein
MTIQTGAVIAEKSADVGTTAVVIGVGGFGFTEEELNQGDVLNISVYAERIVVYSSETTPTGTDGQRAGSGSVITGRQIIKRLSFILDGNDPDQGTDARVTLTLSGL